MLLNLDARRRKEKKEFLSTIEDKLSLGYRSFTEMDHSDKENVIGAYLDAATLNDGYLFLSEHKDSDALVSKIAQILKKDTSEKRNEIIDLLKKMATEHVIENYSDTLNSYVEDVAEEYEENTDEDLLCDKPIGEFWGSKYA